VVVLGYLEPLPLPLALALALAPETIVPVVPVLVVVIINMGVLSPDTPNQSLILPILTDTYVKVQVWDQDQARRVMEARHLQAALEQQLFLLPLLLDPQAEREY